MLICFLNPRDYTIYNRRKDCVGDSIVLMMRELEVITLLQCIFLLDGLVGKRIDQYPKVPELWDHRRYCLRFLMKSNQCK